MYCCPTPMIASSNPSQFRALGLFLRRYTLIDIMKDTHTLTCVLGKAPSMVIFPRKSLLLIEFVIFGNIRTLIGAKRLLFKHN